MANLSTPPGTEGRGSSAPAKKPRQKSNRKLAFILLFTMLGLVLLVAMIANPDFGQKQQKAAQAKHNLAVERTRYSRRIANPSDASKLEYDNALSAIKERRRAQVGAAQLRGSEYPSSPGSISSAIAPPQVGLPPPPTNGYNDLAYSRAHAAITRGQSGNAPRVGVAEAANAQPSFVVFSAKASKSLNPVARVASQAHAVSAQESANQQAEQACNGDPQCVQAREQAAEAQAQQRAAGAVGAGGGAGPADAADLNANWLYRAQNSQVKTFKPLVAETGKGLYWVAPGTVINGVLESAIDTRLPGQIIVRVLSNVYDSRYGRYLVIPAGSILQGTYNSTVKDGQHRVMVAMKTLVTPSGGEVALGAMTLSDGIGMSGVPGNLHTHFWSRMGVAFLMGLEADEMDRLSNVQQVVASPYGGGASNNQGISSGGQIVVDAANQQLKEMFALGPNITVKPGAVVTLMLSQGTEIPPVANTR